MAEATTFGDGLRRLRTERGLSLAQVARLVHYSKGYLSNVENGRKPVNPGLARRLDEALEAAGLLTDLAGVDGSRCPYQGLAAFEAEDAGRFFGRERATAALLGRLTESRGSGLPLVVFGASGAGKSSLLRAGLVPALLRGALPVDGAVRVITPTAEPVADPPPGGVLIVDQFEEVFTLCEDPVRRREFIRELCHAAAGTTLVVLGVRADFFGACLAHPQLLEAVRHNQFTVGAMCRQELIGAITGPAEEAGLSVEPGLVELLLRDLGVTGDDPAADYDPGALPLLSYALMGTWQQRAEESLTVAGYRLTGGIDGAVAGAAERAYEQLSEEAQQAARRLLLRLVRIDERDEPARRRVRRQDLLCGNEKATLAAIDTLTEARLLVLDRDTVEITHEALLRAWPRLGDWLAADRAGLRLHRQLTEAAQEWAGLGHDPGALYSGSRLTLARQWANDHEDELSPAERDFLRASEAAGQRRTRNQRRLIALLAILLVLATTASAIAIRSEADMAEQRDLALSRGAVTSAQAIQETDSPLAVQLRLAAYRRSPTPEMRDAVLAAFTAPYRASFAGHTSDVVSVAYAPKAPLVATISWDRTARLWDIGNPHRPTELSRLTLTADGNAVAFHPGGTVLAVADPTGLRLWDISDPRSPKSLFTVPAHTMWTAFSPDGRLLATGEAEGVSRVWDVSDPRQARELHTLRGHEHSITSVTFSPDSRLLATTGDTTARIWELGERPRLRGVLTGHSASVRHAAFSPDGAVLATSSWDRTVQLWRLADLHRLSVIDAHQAIMWSAAFSPDGRRLATVGGTTNLWEVADPAAPRKVSSLPGGTYQVAFSPDGSTLATPQWLLPLRELPLTKHEDNVTSAAFSPNGDLLATGSWDRTVRIWDARQPRPLAVLSGPAAFVRAVAFQPGGHLLAAASEDGAVWLWDIRDPANIRQLPPLRADTGEIGGLAFSRDGRLLAAAGHYTVTLWDVAERRELSRLGSFAGGTLGAAFSPGDQVLTTWSRGGGPRRWDVTDPTRPKELPRPAEDVPSSSVALSPDGRLLAVFQQERGTLRLLDASGELAVISGLPTQYRMEFSPDGRWLAAGGDLARVWDVSDPRNPVERARLNGHTGPVPGVAFSPDSQRLVTTGNDRTIHLWDTDVDRVAARICTVAYPRITPEVWARHFPDQEFTPPC